MVGSEYRSRLLHAYHHEKHNVFLYLNGTGSTREQKLAGIIIYVVSEGQHEYRSSHCKHCISIYDILDEIGDEPSLVDWSFI